MILDPSQSPGALFGLLIGMTARDREAALSELRGSSAELAAELEDLLRYHDREEAILDRSPSSGVARHAGPEAAPEQIAGYRITRELGAGGMGVVYEAQQESPARAVALKVIRPGLVSRSLTKRFTHEAAALARLQHPGIAQVYEAGVDAGAGRPFIAMELIRGTPLNEFVRNRKPQLEDKLSLFLKICDAVEHAHRRGVIHRDLKPGNILIDSDGNPKVLDFGLSRFTDSDRAVTTVATNVGQILGTLSYMSPEQAQGSPGVIDERSDVYALGVILYELLAGKLPIEVSAGPVHEALRAITTDEPTSISVVDRRLRGDLDTITRRALEKDPSRRYQHAADLRDDVRRFLENQPIAARPPSAMYQLRKFAKRNRGLVVGACALFLALTAGVIGTGWQAVRATREARRAEEKARAATEAGAFLSELLLAALPERVQGRTVTVRDVVDDAAKRLDASPPESLEVRVALLRTLGEVYTGIGDMPAAIARSRAAYDLARSTLGAEAPETLSAAAVHARVLNDADQFDDAKAFARAAIEASVRVLGPEHVTTLSLKNALANSLIKPDELEEARNLHRTLVEVNVRLHGEKSGDAMIAKNNFATFLGDNGAADEGLKLHLDLLETRRGVLGPKHPETLTSMLNVAVNYSRLGDTENCRLVGEQLYPLAVTVWGSKHPNTAKVRMNLALACYYTGRHNRAAGIAREIWELAKETDGATSPNALFRQGFLCQLLIHAKRFDEALPLMEEVRRESISRFGEKSQEAVNALTLYFNYYQALGDAAQQAKYAELLKGTHFDPATHDEPGPPLIDGPDADHTRRVGTPAPLPSP